VIVSSGRMDWQKWGITHKLITTSESTSPSTPPYPFFTTSSQTSPSRTFVTKPLQSWPPKACFPSSGSSSTTAFNMVRYKLQTFIRVVRDAFEIGEGSGSAFVSSEAGGVITGRIVDRDSGNRRVKNSCEDCRYILEIWEEACRVVDEERDEMDEVRSCEEVKVSLVGLRVVAMEPLEAIVGIGICWRVERREKGVLKKGRGRTRVSGMSDEECERDPAKASAQRLRQNDWSNLRRLVVELCGSA
jgi:hypothetical protein